MNVQTPISSSTDALENDCVEHDLAALINATGKLRMLSHQIVMCRLIHCDAATPEKVKSTFQTRLTTALAEFKRITRLLTQPHATDDISLKTAELLIESGVVTDADSALLERFIRTASRLTEVRSDTEMATLGGFVAGELLAGLNNLIDRISATLDGYTATLHAEQAPLMDAAKRSLAEIDRLAKTLQIVAMNASLEANRAGQNGVAFGTIAREMREIGAKSLSEAMQMRDDLEHYRKSSGIRG